MKKSRSLSTTQTVIGRSPFSISITLCGISWTLWQLGYPDQALKRSNEALAIAQTLSDPMSLALAQYFRRRSASISRRSTRGSKACRDYDYPMFREWVTQFFRLFDHPERLGDGSSRTQPGGHCTDSKRRGCASRVGRGIQEAVFSVLARRRLLGRQSLRPRPECVTGSAGRRRQKRRP